MQKGLSVAHGASKPSSMLGRRVAGCRGRGRVGKEGRLGEYQVDVLVGGLLRLAVGILDGDRVVH